MVKDKNKELEYKAEGKRRMVERKRKRNNKYRRLSAQADEIGVPLSAIKHNAPWKCSHSSTGMRQICSYEGTCEFPCNGDC